MKYIKEKDQLETTDLPLVATLYYFGCKIEAIDKSNASRVIFIFNRSKEIDQLAQGFWAHSLLVEPLAYFNSLKEIKTRIYQTTR